MVLVVATGCANEAAVIEPVPVADGKADDSSAVTLDTECRFVLRQTMPETSTEPRSWLVRLDVDSSLIDQGWLPGVTYFSSETRIWSVCEPEPEREVEGGMVRVHVALTDGIFAGGVSGSPTLRIIPFLYHPVEQRWLLDANRPESDRGVYVQDSATEDRIAPDDALCPLVDSEPDAERVEFAFDADTDDFPPGMSFVFADYPIREDDDAVSPDRVAWLEGVTARLTEELGREPLLTDYARHATTDVLQAGYWLNARFEPVLIDDDASALVVTQVNRSDDTDTNILFELGPEHGLRPNTAYELRVEVDLRTNAPVGCLGAGGSPHSVRFDASLSRTPFSRAIDHVDHWRVTNREGVARLEPGQDPLDTDALAGIIHHLGNIGAPNATECASIFDNEYENTTIGQGASTSIRTDARPTLYGRITTHSGFESISLWAVRGFRVTLIPQP